MREKESDWAKRMRKLHTTLLPLKYLALAVYCLLTQFERPDWCLDIIQIKNETKDADDPQYQDWDEYYCNDEAANYTNSNLPKFSPYLTMSIQIVCITTLIGFSMIRNQYRSHDSSSLKSWKI